ncbi:MAG: flagellar biosynthesis anti-sigma factor FlgM [Epulopiscium sp. Nele67-Bin004]|nr:MAG: flagellar biosynthesis anti-sigma factor FlgM [Epulopiscium sp. Nele67-Bin004]
MRIGSIDSISQIYQTQTGAIGKPQSVQKQDEVQVSDEALMRGIAYRAAKDTPDVRMDLVNDIKNQIQNGTYDVSARDVSEKIVNQLSM